jgi:hypothetical protein
LQSKAEFFSHKPWIVITGASEATASCDGADTAGTPADCGEASAAMVPGVVAGFVACPQAIAPKSAHSQQRLLIMRSLPQEEEANPAKIVT